MMLVTLDSEIEINISTQSGEKSTIRYSTALRLLSSVEGIEYEPQLNVRETERGDYVIDLCFKEMPTRKG